MPLSYGLRDEENERINSILNRLMELAHVPEGWLLPETEKLLAQLGLSSESLGSMEGDELNSHLDRMHFDWDNREKLADLLAAWGRKPQARAIYIDIQARSGAFSFGILNKINQL